MSGYLIDTNVISECNREQLPHAGVVKWLDTTPEASQYVSVLTQAEIEKGILRKEEGKRRRDPRRWFDEDRFSSHPASGDSIGMTELTEQAKWRLVGGYDNLKKRRPEK